MNIRVEIEKLVPRNGDVIIIRCPELDDRERASLNEDIGRISAMIREDKPNVVILAIPHNFDIKLLDEEMMKREGWISITRI